MSSLFFSNKERYKLTCTYINFILLNFILLYRYHIYTIDVLRMRDQSTYTYFFKCLRLNWKWYYFMHFKRTQFDITNVILAWFERIKIQILENNKTVVKKIEKGVFNKRNVYIYRLSIENIQYRIKECICNISFIGPNNII